MDTYKGLLRRAQVWIETKQENFDPLVWNEKKAAYTRRKAFAELAIYAYVLGADGGSDADESLNRTIIETANSPEYHRLILRNPRQLLLYSSPLGYAIATMQASPSTVRYVEIVLSRPQVFGVERSAHRMMDLWQFLTMIDRRPDWLCAKQVLVFSALSQPNNAFDFTLSEAYALTHNVLFLKNFGVPDTRFEIDVNYVLDRQSLALTMSRFISEGNSDIVLELLMTLGLLGQLNGRDCRLILDWIVSRNGASAYISGPNIDPDDNVQIVGLDWEWVANYHTTLVGCSAILLAERNNWLENDAVSPLFDTTIDDIVLWGEVVSLLNRYEIPKAIAIIDSVVEWTDFGKDAANCVDGHLSDITEEQTGIVGYWVDEIKAAEILDGQSEMNSDLRELSKLALDVLKNVPM